MSAIGSILGLLIGILAMSIWFYIVSLKMIW
jgi:hypothetical protein